MTGNNSGKHHAPIPHHRALAVVQKRSVIAGSEGFSELERDSRKGAVYRATRTDVERAFSRFLESAKGHGYVATHSIFPNDKSVAEVRLSQPHESCIIIINLPLLSISESMPGVVKVTINVSTSTMGGKLRRNAMITLPGTDMKLALFEMHLSKAQSMGEFMLGLPQHR